MNSLYINHIASQLSVRAWQVENCIQMLEEGATVPFISRYRKERTGSMDDVAVAEVRHYYQKFTDLEKRKEAILKSIEEQGKLTESLKAAIEGEVDARTVEDLYLPFRPKRRTRATVAREKGLEPLAVKIYDCSCINPLQEAQRFVKGEVTSADDALSGARDIIAETVSENQAVRSALRDLYSRWGGVSSKISGKAENDPEADKYRNYFDYREKLDRIPSHRLLAVLRAADAGYVKVKVDVQEEYALERINRQIIDRRNVRPSSGCREQLKMAATDSYRRLLHPSIENETLSCAKEKADLEAIKVFGENLKELLLAPPVGQKRTLAIDPGFRTGCKVVCLDAQGELLHNETIFPHPPVNGKIASMKKISQLVEAYRIEVIAIGNGTAGRETEEFIKKTALPEGVKVYSVSEDGASVYSASEVARKEFPSYDVTVRGAVSIGRRLMDPLAELVKIDPKSIGVGQYQHDVDQSLLKSRLDETVENCVNRVGVNLNTASGYLLGYVSGIGPALAENIVEYRAANGPFRNRKQLLSVKRLGDKVFEQCAGFLRIPDSDNPLDNTAVHPERYALVEKMAGDAGMSLREFVDAAPGLSARDLDRYVSTDVGMQTLTDIIAELSKKGRDPRGEIGVFEFAGDIHSIEDLKEGMVLPGIVTNVTAFGAFVDIGIYENGLLHVSQMSDRRVSDPSAIVRVHQQLKVRIIGIDPERKRISLSLKGV